jgi:sn-glycerol 3-phosphate transport system substrate-binding protein
LRTISLDSTKETAAMLRRLFPVALTIVLALALAACGSPGGSPGSSSSSGTQTAASGTPDTAPVHLVFWHSMSGANGDALNALVQKFNASQSRITVDAQFQGTYDDSINKLRTGMQSKSTPNVIQVYDIGTKYMSDSGAITPVQNFIDRDKYDMSAFEPNVLAYYKVNDKLYSMPFNTSNPIIYYNKDEFKAAGLDPEKPPTTFEEIESDAKALTKKDASGNYTQQGYDIYIYGWFLEQSLATQGQLYADNGNGRDKAATKATFNSAQGEAWVQFLEDMNKDGTALNTGRMGAAQTAAFTSGKVAMMMDSTASLRGILNGVGGKFQVGTAFMPRPANNPQAAGTIIGGASLWVMSDHPQREQDAAWEFLKFLSAPEQQADWYVGTGYYPIRKDAYNQPNAQETLAKYPQFNTAVQQLHAAPVNRATQGALLGVYTQARNDVETQIEAVLAGQASPKDALDKAAAQVNDEITAYNKAVSH